MGSVSDFVEMKLPAKPEYVGVVRLTLSGIANRLGYNYDDIEDIKIAVAEACTNIVNYSNESEKAHLKVGCRVFDNRIEINVGKCFENDRKESDFPPSDLGRRLLHVKEVGFGLFLIDTLMDEVEIRDEKEVYIIMTKFLQKGGVGRSGEEANARK